MIVRFEIILGCWKKSHDALVVQPSTSFPTAQYFGTGNNCSRNAQRVFDSMWRTLNRPTKTRSPYARHEGMFGEDISAHS